MRVAVFLLSLWACIALGDYVGAMGCYGKERS